MLSMRVVDLGDVRTAPMLQLAPQDSAALDDDT